MAHFPSQGIAAHPLQEYPELTKQPEWTGAQPEKVDWDAEIEQVLEKGKEVPEITWCSPGEDAGVEVSFPVLSKSLEVEFLMCDNLPLMNSAIQSALHIASDSNSYCRLFCTAQSSERKENLLSSATLLLLV